MSLDQVKALIKKRPEMIDGVQWYKIDQPKQLSDEIRRVRALHQEAEGYELTDGEKNILESRLFEAVYGLCELIDHLERFKEYSRVAGINRTLLDDIAKQLELSPQELQLRVSHFSF